MKLNMERINELARMSKQRELTDTEKAEQSELRQNYIAAYRENLRAQLQNIVLLDEDGTKRKIAPKSVKEK